MSILKDLRAGAVVVLTVLPGCGSLGTYTPKTPDQVAAMNAYVKEQKRIDPWFDLNNVSAREYILTGNQHSSRELLGSVAGYNGPDVK